ncbi:MAG: hypothetical protein AAB370_03560 [Verrucomicrobiota bacterium]
MQLITVSTALNSADANLTASRLDAAGFHPSIKGELAALSMEGYALAAGGILVQVPDAEAAEAREFLDSPVTLDTPLE